MGRREDTLRAAGYQVAQKNDKAKPVNLRVVMRPGKKGRLDKSKRAERLINRFGRVKASMQDKVKHTFRMIKRQFGLVKVCYRGLAENTAQLTTLFTLNKL